MVFNFEKEIKLFVSSIDQLLLNQLNSNKDHTFNKILSVQLVNFQGETDSFDVYNYCWQEEKYFSEVIKHFSEKAIDGISAKYKSPLNSIKCPPYLHDDGVWYKERERKSIISPPASKYSFEYQVRTNIKTDFDNKVSYDESIDNWEAWSNLILNNIYSEFANSVYLKKITIEITDKILIHSGIFLSFTDVISHKHIGIISNICEDLLNRIAYQNLIPLLYKNITRQATRAAISQVMARNMSHNIGSHVLSRMIDTETIAAFIKSPLVNRQYQSINLHTNDEDSKVPAKLIATFNSYMKSRMDFLADITTGVPTIENTKWFFKEVLSGFDKNRVLLDRISGINEFHFKIEARNYTEKDIGCTATDALIKEYLSNDEYKIVNDLMVSVPNDILGCHSLYIILENIIRNCAKHSDIDSTRGKAEDTPITIFIDIKERTEEACNELYELVIYDDNPITKTFNIQDQKSKEKYLPYINITDPAISQISYLEKLVVDQNIRLNQSVLHNGTLRQGAWGLIEMDSSAAYLRKIAVEDIDENKYDIDIPIVNNDHIFTDVQLQQKVVNVLKAITVADKYLGYRIFLYKPREILIIDDCNVLSHIQENDKKNLLKNGILLCNNDTKTHTFKYNEKTIYNHKLVIIISNSPSIIIEKNSSGLSKRIIKFTSDQATNDKFSFLIVDNERFKRETWNYYLLNAGFDFFQEYYGLFNSSEIIKAIKNNNSTKTATYCDHGNGYINSESIYKEVMYAAVKSFMPINKSDTITIIQHLDSIHSNIVIMDERIQEYCVKGTYNENITISDIYKSTNIFVPSPENDDVNLGRQNFDKEYRNILKFISNHSKATFFVIHLGVIEKLIASHNRTENVPKEYDKDDAIKIRDFLNEVICVPYSIEYNNIIIISGRGTPHNLPTNTRYLNYSIISQYTIDIRFKYLLSEAVYSARRIK